jgi:hypothetical protein
MIANLGTNETQWAIAMEWLAKKEGRTKVLPQASDTQKHRPGVKRNCSPETLKMMRMIAERQYSTRQLARLTGISTDQVSWRLMSMVRNDFLAKGEPDIGTKYQRPCATFKAGPRMGEWLKTYEGVK